MDGIVMDGGAVSWALCGRAHCTVAGCRSERRDMALAGRWLWRAQHQQPHVSTARIKQAVDVQGQHYGLWLVPRGCQRRCGGQKDHSRQSRRGANLGAGCRTCSPWWRRGWMGEVRAQGRASQSTLERQRESSSERERRWPDRGTSSARWRGTDRAGPRAGLPRTDRAEWSCCWPTSRHWSALCASPVLVGPGLRACTGQPTAHVAARTCGT